MTDSLEEQMEAEEAAFQEGVETGRRQMRERVAQLCHEKAIGIGAVDGYDYRSGQEAAFREACILIRALPLSSEQEGDDG